MASGLIVADAFERERAVGNGGDDQLRLRQLVVLGLQVLAVETDAVKCEVLAVEFQCARLSAMGWIGADLEAGADGGGRRMKGNGEVDGVDEIGRRAIVFEADGAGCVGFHGGLMYRINGQTETVPGGAGIDAADTRRPGGWRHLKAAGLEQT